jgi:hypothetical protein
MLLLPRPRFEENEEKCLELKRRILHSIYNWIYDVNDVQFLKNIFLMNI